MEQLGGWVIMTVPLMFFIIAVYALSIIDRSVRGDQSLTGPVHGGQGGGQAGGVQAVVGNTGDTGGHTSNVGHQRRKCSVTSSNTSSSSEGEIEVSADTSRIDPTWRPAMDGQQSPDTETMSTDYNLRKRQ